jgi:hypothetical protein
MGKDSVILMRLLIMAMFHGKILCYSDEISYYGHVSWEMILLYSDEILLLNPKLVLQWKIQLNRWEKLTCCQKVFQTR